MTGTCAGCTNSLFSVSDFGGAIWGSAGAADELPVASLTASATAATETFSMTGSLDFGASTGVFGCASLPLKLAAEGCGRATGPVL